MCDDSWCIIRGVCDDGDLWVLCGGDYTWGTVGVYGGVEF